MQQCARQLTDPFDGSLLGERYLIHDSDTTCTQTFDGLLKSRGVEALVLPPRSPHVNAHCARVVRSIPEEVLNRMIMIGEAPLRHVIRSYLVHSHTERHHQSLENQRIAPEPQVGGQTGQVMRRERLGGLRSYYHHEAA